ncbi:MAG TPA: 4'-phosphopantetheinyl transferase superfamily protein [Terriglobales bacterium]|jgi:4'-phosphopantetheinyl transferase|nr:4'-phosphopantetheinyl transferase superfamily protein [Terriglobales bacterium]
MRESKALPARSEGNSGQWLQAPSTLTCSTGDVDVWRVRLDEPEGAGTEASILAPDENVRASRFHFEKDRVHFVRCRSALRRLLAAYLSVRAAEICFEYLSGGKPQLAVYQNSSALEFNVSHSGSIALIAVGSGQRIGVDIEKIRPDVDADALAERFFSVRERAGLRALPDHLRVAGFFACWTRKEAFLKATGDGLSFPLADFSVSTNPDVPPQLEEIRGDREAGKKWLMADLSVGNGYRAAVTSEGPLRAVNTYAWN